MGGRFEGKVVLITGASSGIGEAVATRIVSEGGAVVLGARREREGEAVAAGIRESGGEAVFVPTDVTIESDVAALVHEAMAEFGRVDGAFNNAGAVKALGPIDSMTTEAWTGDLTVNLTGVFHSMKHEVPALLASGGGSIVNNASCLGLVGLPMIASYVAAKHGVIGLTRSVALELAQSGVRVNALATGAVDTPMLEGFIDGDPERDTANREMHPQNRVGTPEEIAAFAAYLLSDESAFITGAALAIDGGWTAR